MSAFRDLRAVVGYALDLEERLQDSRHQLQTMTPVQYDSKKTDELQALTSADLLVEGVIDGEPEGDG